ncbi:hypothetical protein [Streptococcus infantis]|nr:hypothetical protein [Streptococcus infantis]
MKNYKNSIVFGTVEISAVLFVIKKLKEVKQMEIITKIITGLGVVGTITGLIWIWNGSVDYIQGRKNKDKQRQDDGSDSMINGAFLAVASAGIAAAVVASLSQLKF